MFDWSTHKKHRNQVMEDQITWAGLLDENMTPLMDSAPIIPGTLTAPGMRNSPTDFSVQVQVRSARGVTHPMVDELIADGLGDIDAQGRLVPLVDATRFFAIQRSGMQQRVYKIRFVVARGGPFGPVTLEIHASDELSLLNGFVAWSVPTSVTGGWVRLDRDWAAEWKRERDVQNLTMAAQADGFSMTGPAEATIRRLVHESLVTSCHAVGVDSDLPFVVSRIGSDEVSPDLILRPTDGPLWDTISAAAMASGVTVSVRAWWPGDPQPAGQTLSLPTMLVEIRHVTANPVVVPASDFEVFGPEVPPVAAVPPTAVPPVAVENSDVLLLADGAELTVGRTVAPWVYGKWQVTIPEGTEQDVDTRVTDGYVYRPDGAPTGRFDIAFVQADVAMDMNAQTSNVENQLDSAVEKAAGGVFFDRDIEGRGLGRYKPGIDFGEGDFVDVLVWGMRINSMVTAIDYVGLIDSRVHVGGQMIADPMALELQNSEVWDAIRAERFRAEQEAARLKAQQSTDRQQTQQIGQIASQAQNTANQAKSTAEDLEELTSVHESDLSVTWKVIDGLEKWSRNIWRWADGQMTDAEFKLAMIQSANYFLTTSNQWQGPRT